MDFEQWYSQFGNSFVNRELAQNFFNQNYGGGGGNMLQTEKNIGTWTPQTFTPNNSMPNYGQPNAMVNDFNSMNQQLGLNGGGQPFTATQFNPQPLNVNTSGAPNFQLGEQPQPYLGANTPMPFDINAPQNSPFTYADQIANANATASSGMGIPLGTTVVGAVELISGLASAYKHRNDKADSFNITSEVKKSQADLNALSGQGFSESEKQAYEDKVYNDTISKYIQGRNASGGQMSQAVLSTIVGQNSGQRNALAIEDARLNRQNTSVAANYNQYVQGLEDQKTNQQRQDYYAQQAAISGAIKSGLQNIGAGLNPISILKFL
jgi:hypothetical protein